MIQEDLSDYLELENLHRFSGSPKEFWTAFLQLAIRIEQAAGGEILLRKRADEKTPWRRICQAAGPGTAAIPDAMAQPLAERALQEGVAAVSAEGVAVTFLAVALKTGDEGHDSVLMLAFPQKTPEELRPRLSRLLLIADTPAVYRRNLLLQQVQGDITSFASTLDLLTVLHGQTRFGSACMALSNELASRFQCSQVAVGWVRGKYVRVRAVSNLDEVTGKMEAVQKLEAAMEEAIDQNDEIILPAPEESSLVTRDNEAYLQQEGAKVLLSLPLRERDQQVGAITLLREKTPFEDREIRALRVAADQAGPLLEHVRRRDRWFGARWAEDGREVLGKLWGVDHAWTKLAGVLAGVGLGILVFGQMTYRVEAPFIVRTEMQAFVSAPYDGYIAHVYSETGDAVVAGQLLLRCDDAELRVQQASLLADIRRFQSEAERARGLGDFAQMRISRAQEEQSRANLELVQLQLGGAELRAPFDALVVEDNQLRQRIGAPIQRGEGLMKLARTDQLYVELRVKERNIDNVQVGGTGEIAFATRPNLKISIEITKVEPAATSQEEGGIFLARAQLLEEGEDWWRPGMTGVAKVEVGKRPIIWIISHRLVDFIRLKLWI